MNVRWLVAAIFLFISAGTRTEAAQELPIGQREPLLRVDGNGPTSSVTALAFSPDGQMLYAAGYDKIVRVWQLDKKTGRFNLDAATYRVVVGPGRAGAINTIALSADGDWLALGGLGVLRGGTDFRNPGFVFPQVGAMDDTIRQDQGMIYVYKTDSTGNKPPEVHLLRGHRGPVLATRFAPSGKRLFLVSAALEWDEKANAFAGVLRLWDVAKETCLATLSRGLPRANVQPGLAVWRVGQKPDQLRVAISWGDGLLRLWDVARGAEGLHSVTDGPSNAAVAYLPGVRPALITTSFRAPQGDVRRHHGQIQAWNVPDDPQRKPTEGSARAVLPRPLAESSEPLYFLPKLLVPFSSRGNGKLDRAAILFRLSAPDQKDHLQIIDLDPAADKFGDVKAEVPLWLPAESAPVLAAASNGQHLAVAGNRDHEIVVYSIPDLVNNIVKSQTLHSVGVTMSEASFVQKGKAAGLRLRPAGERGRKRKDLIFDFAHRSLSEDDGWKNAGPDLQGWALDLQARLDQDGKKWQQIVVSRQENATGQPIQLNARQRVTSHALLPPMKPLNTPILALGYLDFESGEAALALYDVSTGSRIRQLAGHVDPIRSLAFSGDGKLLASAAEDQTVCLWSMANLDQVLNERGLLPDLAVAKGKGGVVVKEVKRGSPAFGKLAVGDLIQGVVRGGRALQPLASPRTFYETMWQEKPGTTITLRVKNKDAVQVRVGQGIDERNPLLSLFVTRADRVTDQEWIAWSPLGYYDGSAPKAERHLVWHFNKGMSDEPTATAGTGQFRREYRRQGLLKFLVARATLGGALEDWKKEEERKNRPKPNLMMWIDEIGPDPKKRDDRGRVPVRTKRLTLKLAIADFVVDETDSIEWQWENGAWQKFQKHTGSEWSVDLSGASWKRGTNRLRAILRTSGEGPQRFTEALSLSYQPAPPRVKFKGDLRQVVKDPRFSLNAEIVPAAESPDVNVTLSHEHEGKELLAGAERSTGLDVGRRLTLKPGRNVIRISARNKDALKGAEEKETSRVTIEAIYTKKDAPPRISLAVETLPNGPKVPVEAGQAIVVTAPRVRLTGAIEAEGKLTQPEWRKDEGKRVALSGVAGTGGTSWPIDEVLVIEAGLKPTEIRFFAATSASDEADARVRIAYHPGLPRISLTAPADELVLYEGEGKPRVKVEGKLAWPDDAHPCKAAVMVNGIAAAGTTLEKGTNDFAEEASLAPGDNRIQVRLTNAWKKTSTTETILVRYLRPPRIEIVADNGRLVSRKPLIAVEGKIYSAVPVKTVRAEINGPSGRRVVAAKLAPPADKEIGTPWRVQLTDVALEAGKNELTIWASNLEASTRKPASVTIVYEPPPKPPVPPRVEMVYPALDVKVTNPDLEVKARITSAGPLKRVELIREGRSPLRVELDVAAAKPNPQGFYELTGKIKLVPQENVLRLEAVNAGGGSQSAPIAVSYIPQRPVRASIQYLQAKRSTVKVQPIPSTFDRGLVFGEVLAAKVWVVGEVTWDPESDALLGKDHQIDLYVNGLRQLPVNLEAAAGKERSRTFKAEVSLTRAKNNLLQIELPAELKRNADNQPRYLVNCKKPADRQRVYLLPISVGEKDEKRFMKRILGVLQAKDINADQDRFRTPVFAEGRVYGPLTGYVNRRQVLTQLNRIKQDMIDQKKIDLRNPADAPADVLLLYFRGSDSVASGKYELRTSDRRIAVTRAQLLKEFGETLGAQILLLDVDRQGAGGDAADRVARWPDDSRVSLFRSASMELKNSLPHQPFLIDALAEALRRVGKLGEVATEVKSQLRKMGKPNSQLTFDDYCPDPLADLLLGTKK